MEFTLILILLFIFLLLLNYNIYCILHPYISLILIKKCENKENSSLNLYTFFILLFYNSICLCYNSYSYNFIISLSTLILPLILLFPSSNVNPTFVPPCASYYSIIFCSFFSSFSIILSIVMYPN